MMHGNSESVAGFTYQLITGHTMLLVWSGDVVIMLLITKLP